MVFERTWRRLDPAQRTTLWMGAWFVLNGIGAFLFNPRFTLGTGGGNLDGLSPLTLSINGWHALLHLIPGLIGVAVAFRPAAARNWAWSVAVLYLVAGIWGLIDGHSALVLISVERFGSVVHLIEAAIAGWTAVRVTGWIPARWWTVERAVGAAVFGLLGVAAVATSIADGVLTFWCCGAIYF